MWSITVNLVLWNCLTLHNFLFMNQYPDDSLLNQRFDEQLCLNELYELGLSPHPSYATGFLDKREHRSRGSKITGHLHYLGKLAQKRDIKQEESYKTITQITELLFPQEWAEASSKPEFERLGRLIINPRQEAKQILIRKTRVAMRAVDRKIRNKLKSCGSEKEKLLFIINKLEMLVRVGSTEKGEFLFAYHGHDIRQSLDILRMNLELTQEHVFKQGATMRLADRVYKAETRPIQTELPLKLDPDFKPQDDPDIFGEEFNSSGDYGQ